MIFRMRRLSALFAIILLTALLWGCAASQKPDRSALKTALQGRLDSLVVAAGVPGATFAMAFADDDVINLASGVADLETGEPLKPTARMFGGSTGKIWVAAVALKLVEEGRLGLDDRVADYLGGNPWYDTIANAEAITVRNLLNHTTGIPRHVLKPELWQMLKDDPDRVVTKEACVAFIGGEPAVHPAGEGWAYSDTNYILLGLVIEKVTGQHYEDILRERILKPYKLTRTGVQDSRVIDDLPSGYTAEGAPFFLPAKVPVDGKYPINPLFEWQGGGLVGNVVDMARWARIDWGGEWLNAETQAALESPVNLRTGQPDEWGWGLGVNLFSWEGHRVLSHGGIFPGYETFIAYFPEWGFGAAVQMNADRTSGKQKISPAGLLLEMVKTAIPLAYPEE